MTVQITKCLLLLALVLTIVAAAPGRSHKTATHGKEKKIKRFEGSKDAKIRTLKSKSPDGSLGKFPEFFPLEIETDEGSTVLFLKRNDLIQLEHVNVKFADESDTNIKKAKKRTHANTAYYTDPASGAAITVKSKQGNLQFEGTIVSGGQRFELRPANNAKGHTLERVEPKINFDDPNGGDTFADPHYDQTMPHVDPKVFNKEEDILDDNEEDGKLRKRRSVNGQQQAFHVDLMMLFDYSTWSYWLARNGGDVDEATDEMLTYFGEIFNGMQMAYSSISTHYADLSINLWLSKIVICNTPESSWFTEEVALAHPNVESPTESKDYALMGSETFQKLAEWRFQNGYNWSNPDHIMVFTNFDINGNNAVGVAPTSSIGRGKASWGGASLVEDIGFHTWVVAAHELAHNLGATHDGNGNDCSADDNFIMSPGVSYLTPETAANTYTFSPCSAARLKDNILGILDSYPRANLFDTTCEHHYQLGQVDTTLPGQVYSLDEQCELMWGTGAVDCTPSSAEICMQVACRRPEEECYYVGWAADGTLCDTDKWCMSGQCVSNTVGKAFPGDSSCGIFSHALADNCEDLPQYTLFIDYYGTPRYMTCDEIIVEDPQFCFMFSTVAAGCDRTCMKHGLVYDGATCDGACSDTPEVTFSGGYTCSEAANDMEWCGYDVVQQFCCGSCAAVAKK